MNDGMHIIGQDGGYDGDDVLYEMKLRDSHQKETVLSGACDDDCETTSPLDDSREEQDVFLSRPLRLASISKQESDAYNQNLAAIMRAGFETSFAGAVFDRETSHARQPFDLVA